MRGGGIWMGMGMWMSGWGRSFCLGQIAFQLRNITPEGYHSILHTQKRKCTDFGWSLDTSTPTSYYPENQLRTRLSQMHHVNRDPV